jgi:hypothetical protein
MKYIKNTQLYKSEILLNEAFENDITWGGSLLGRLINSTIRKMKIGYKYTKVNNVIKRLKEELDSLVEYYASDDINKRINEVKYKMILEELYKEVESDKDIQEKLNVLLGTNTLEGLIDTTISEVEKSEIENKEQLLEKLRKFKEDLLEIERTDKDTDEESDGESSDSEDQGSKNDPAIIFFNNSKILISTIIKLNIDIKNNPVKFQSGVKGDGEKTETFFDENKYKQQRTNTIDEIKKKIEMAKKAVSVYTNSNNKERVNFYNSEIKKYEAKLKMKSGDKSTTVTGQTSQYDMQADKRAKEELQKMHARESVEFITEEIDANLREQEVDAKRAWNKVVNAWNKSGISKYIPYLESLINTTGVDKIKENKKSIMEIGRQVAINYNTVGKPISLSELISEQQTVSISDVAKSISLFGRTVMAFKEDMGLLGSYGASYKKEGGDAGGVGNHLKSFITSIDNIVKSYPSIKKESVLVKYSDFILLKEEADDIDPQSTSEATEEDRVKKSWFKFFRKGEEKEWKVDEKKAKDLNEELEKMPYEITPDKKDPIIAIVNIFGRAYDLYATDYIPSGRPNGRISLKTMREYEYIGSSGRSTPEWRGENGPGYGPWAARFVYDKWQEGVRKILEDKKYRTVLANGKFISEAETSTNTPMEKKPGSGKTLFNFINDMLNSEGASFKKRSYELMEKYFGTKDAGDRKDIKNGDGNQIELVSEEDKGEIDKPYFTDQVPFMPGIKNIQNDKIMKVSFYDGTSMIMWPNFIKKDDKNNTNYLIFRFQEYKKGDPKESIITDSFKSMKNAKGEKYDDSLLKDENKNFTYSEDLTVYVGGVDLREGENRFSKGENFKYKATDLISVDNGDYSKIVSRTKKIEKIEFLVVPGINKNGKPTKSTPLKFDYDKISIKSKKDRKIKDSGKLVEEFKKTK